MLVIFCLDLPCNGGLRLDNLLLQVKVQLHSQMLIGHHPTFGLIQPQHQKSKIEYNFRKAIPSAENFVILHWKNILKLNLSRMSIQTIFKHNLIQKRTALSCGM